MKDRKEEVKIALLIEHKSAPYKYTPIQIGGYIFSGLLRQIANEGRQEGRREGRQEGRMEGRQEGRMERAEKVVRNLIKSSDFSDEQIANIAEVPAEYVARMRKAMAAGR